MLSALSNPEDWTLHCNLLELTFTLPFCQDVDGEPGETDPTGPVPYTQRSWSPTRQGHRGMGRHHS